MYEISFRFSLQLCIMISLFYYSCHKNENINVETPSYDFLQLNSDHRTMKTNESIVSPLLKTNNTHDKGIIIKKKKKEI
jgi:hypothetical protein